MYIVVEQTQTNHSSLSFRGLECRCSIGKGGITENKVEVTSALQLENGLFDGFFTVKTAYNSQTQAFKLFVFLKIWVGQMTLVMTEDITL